jgi:beta-N-acetylhexosaminidase
MIRGIGTDIVRIARIDALVERWGNRFVRRILGPDELQEFYRRRERGGPKHGHRRAVDYLAKRFAGKEAFSKALGTGLRGPMTLLSLQILNDSAGKPIAVPRKSLASWMQHHRYRAHVSLSDEFDAAIAFVVIEEDPDMKQRVTPRDSSAPYGPVMADIAGLTLTEAERSLLRDPKVGGVILFARNFASRAQLAALTAELHALREPPLPPLLIAVDHEGGRVQRFREGYVHLPPMRQFGFIWDQSPTRALAAATDAGFVLGGELRRDGVDFSFTPVLDLDWGESGVIGDRAFHADPGVVTALARALSHGLLLAGMRNCGKHFPGHGWTRADSHHELPVDDRSLDAILGLDGEAFKAFGTPALASVMTAHVVYPSVDARPATFSPLWLQTVLRERFQYDGVIFSDDLSMEGAASFGSIEERAHSAITAGCDMILVCNAPEQAQRVVACESIQNSPESSRRIANLAPLGPPPSEALLDLVRERLQHLLAGQGD